MRSLPRRKRREARPVYVAAAFAALCAVVLVVARPQWLEALLLETADASSFLREGLVSVGRDVAIGMMSKRDIVGEIERLRNENTALRMRAALYDEVVARLERTEERFGRDPLPYGILGRILAAPTRSPYDTFLLDVGTIDGVSVGDTAWFDTTTAIGIVEEASPHTSRVRLFSSPGYERDVSVGTSTELVTAIGRGGGSFELVVPKDMHVAIDDALMFPADGNGTLGFIRDIIARDADSFQTIYASSPINLFETRELLIRPSR